MAFGQTYFEATYDQNSYGIAVTFNSGNASNCLITSTVSTDPTVAPYPTSITGPLGGTDFIEVTGEEQVGTGTPSIVSGLNGVTPWVYKDLSLDENRDYYWNFNVSYVVAVSANTAYGFGCYVYPEGDTGTEVYVYCYTTATCF